MLPLLARVELDGNKEVLHISQNFIINGASPSDLFVSYPGHSLKDGSYPSTEIQSVDSYCTGRLGKKTFQKLLKTNVNMNVQ